MPAREDWRASGSNSPFSSACRCWTDADTFFKRLASAMKENSPYAADGPALEKLKKLGIEPGKDFDISKIDPGIARGLRRAVKEAPIKLADGTTKMKNVNGWIRPPDLGRYGTDYDTRAGIAMAGLGADLQEDTIYPIAFVDGNGKRLDSASEYVLHFDKNQFPPTQCYLVRLALPGPQLCIERP